MATLLCYECAYHHPISEIQIKDCSECGGRKCFLHAGQQVNKCKDCGKEDLCWDCVSLGRCCEEKMLCYECGYHHSISEMQVEDCSECGGRKCFMHGGQNMHSCKDCGKENLCIDCVSLGRCCHHD